jgi:hypothetical protein
MHGFSPYLLLNGLESDSSFTRGTERFFGKFLSHSDSCKVSRESSLCTEKNGWASSCALFARTVSSLSQLFVRQVSGATLGIVVSLLRVHEDCDQHKGRRGDKSRIFLSVDRPVSPQKPDEKPCQCDGDLAKLVTSVSYFSGFIHRCKPIDMASVSAKIRCERRY